MGAIAHEKPFQTVKPWVWGFFILVGISLAFGPTFDSLSHGSIDPHLNSSLCSEHFLAVSGLLPIGCEPRQRLTIEKLSFLGVSMAVHAGSLHHTAVSGLYSRGISDFNDIGSEEDDYPGGELGRNLDL